MMTWEFFIGFCSGWGVAVLGVIAGADHRDRKSDG